MKTILTDTDTQPAKPGFRIPFGPEIVLAAIAVAVFFLFPLDLAFTVQIMIMCLFVLSLSLVLGQAGVATLGHAAYFGIGAYAAGLCSIHLSAEPITGLLIGGIAGALGALLTGSILLRTHGLTFLMLTVALLQVLYEVANRAIWITGGDDGLSGIFPEPLFGQFEFDMFSRTAFAYVLVVLLISYFLLRKIVASPFGLTARGIRSDRGRVLALGGNVYKHLLVVFTIAGLFAGLAGALSAQTAGVAGLNSLTFGFSGNAVVMLILGGSKRLPGAIVGVVIFMVIQHVAATINPYHWLFVIGLMLIGSILFLPNGLISLIDKPIDWWKKRREGK